MKSCISRSVFLLLLCATTGQGLGQDKQDKQDPADKAKAAQIAQLDKFIVEIGRASCRERV